MIVGILKIDGFRIMLITGRLLRLETCASVNSLKVQRQRLDHPIMSEYCEHLDCNFLGRDAMQAGI
jgi:hypothetical protein